MGDVMRFIVSYSGTFVNIDDTWKCLGDRTTSIVIRRDISYEELVHMLFEKLNIDKMKFRIQLKFKVSNMNIPHVDVADDEDLQWYISVHTQAALCVITYQFDAGEHDVCVGVDRFSLIKDALCGRDEVGVSEARVSQMIHNTNVCLGEGKSYIGNEIQLMDGTSC